VIGHTHEDIDACFGTLKKILRGKTILTLEEFKQIVESAMAWRTVKWHVRDVMIIPDYQKYLEPCIDNKLSKLHKEIQTQHQWRFEAVPMSPLFPLGCKTMYRAYRYYKTRSYYSNN
jgi:hypothetical protein